MPDEESNTAEMLLYGEISEYSWYGDEITPSVFNQELKDLGAVDEITVRINSGGGDVFAAVAIYTRLKEHKAKISVKIDGWCASAATIIAMAGDYSMYYGAVGVTDEAGKTIEVVEGSRIPEQWVERRPPRRFLQLNSAPLCVPHEVDSWYVATVC